MPYASRAQSSLVHALAAQGVPWAVKFAKDAHGSTVPPIGHVKRKAKRVRRRKPGRPRMPLHAVSNDALWKRAQRADNRPPNKGMIRHHTDRSYGRKSPKTEYISRAQHNRVHLRRKAA